MEGQIDGSTQRIYTPARVAIFIDGWNFKYATFDAFGKEVDFVKLLNHFTGNDLLLRAYYYIGEWTPDAIDHYLRVKNVDTPEKLRQDLEEQRKRTQSFLRFLSRNGYMVVKKPLKVFAGGTIKADLDLELAIDMLTLADRCDRMILVSGDGDFVPLVERVAAKGVRVHVVSTQQQEAYTRAQYRAADDLVDVADEFTELADILPLIARN